MQDSKEQEGTLRRPLRVLLAGLALGLAFDLLFNGHLPGVSVVVFAVLVLAGLFVAGRWEKARPLAANLWLPVALLFFAVMCAVRANGFLMFLNIGAGLSILAMMAVYQVQRPAHRVGLRELIAAPLQAMVMALYRGGLTVLDVIEHNLEPSTRSARPQAVPVLRGVLLAAPILIVFTVLLASADLVFADWVEYLLSLAFLDEMVSWIGHSLVALSVGFVAAGALAYAVRRHASSPTERLAAVRLPGFRGVVESAVIVNAVNVLFFLFVLIQIPYLFGGQVNIDPHHYTYAEYARRGFGELVAVAVLTLGLIVGLDRLTPRPDRRRQVAFNVSATVLVGLTCVMLVSAFKRLLLYEMAYGFTRLRIYPHVFMVWLGILLAWFIVTLWLKPERFAVGVLLAALGFCATLDVLNPDALIVHQNYRRSLEVTAGAAAGHASGEVDVAYLAGLSEDAVPALIEAAGRSTGQVRAAIEKDLCRRAAAMRLDRDWQRWSSYHLARARAYRLLVGRYPEDQ